MPDKEISQRTVATAGKSRRSAAAQQPPSRRLPIAGAYAAISRRASDRLRAGHLWVYRSDLEKIVAPTEDHHLLAVHDPRGQLLGTALYSPNSQIALRMVDTAELNIAEWVPLFQQRLRAAVQFRQRLLAGASATDACRLVFSEADSLPGLIADRYGDLVVLQLLTPGMATAGIRATLLGELISLLAPQTVIERIGPRIREGEESEPVNPAPLYSRDPSAGARSSTIFQLNGLKFHFDADSGQKTGAFLDQRENYAAAARYAHGEALDVCTYQGGFALHLARVCGPVTGVDSSRPALEVAERNLALNRTTLGEAPIDWVEANAFDLLRDWSDTGRRFDSIVLDPPAFAKSKRASEGALRGYKELNLRALKMLRPGGILVTCSCSHHVGLEEFTATVTAAAGDAHRRLRLLERRGAAADHPVLLTVPETEYLKCLICQVD